MLILDSASWLEKEDAGFIFYYGDVIDINCSLSHPTINVTLWKKQSKTVAYRQVIPNGNHILQFNQIFKINKLVSSDEGQYQCRAENMTSLNVLKVHLSNGKLHLYFYLPITLYELEISIVDEGKARNNYLPMEISSS